MTRIGRALRSRLHERARHGERGYALAFTAIILIPLLAISAMATDIGGWYDEATELQKAADAAALAGVVWLPDFQKAKEVALQTTKANGYDDADPDITVVVTQISRSELKVTIENADVAIFFASFFLQNMTITREAVGSYVLPVPLGSPKNYFGTGDLITTAGETEFVWAAINPYCSQKENGDPFASAYQAGYNSSSKRYFCPATFNTQYIPAPHDQYEYMIYAPPGRTKPLVVHLYHPSATGTEPGGQKTVAEWVTRFRLFAPDNTPFDDTDNPLATCSGTGESNPRNYSGAVSGTVPNWSGSAWSRFCTISTSAPSGYYRLGVRNDETHTNPSPIPNVYSILATYNGDGVRCDARTNTLCPTVQGRDWLSVYAATQSATGTFFLSDIDAVHAGKSLEITLFDPGEGGSTIEILDPAGNPAQMSWYTTDWMFSGSGKSIDVSGSGYTQPGRNATFKFNERFLVINVDIPADYATRYAGQTWWKVRYKFGTSVTDRTTWSVRVIGDPVHLAN